MTAGRCGGRTMSSYLLLAIVGALFVPGLVKADDIPALWIEPSLKWYGIDGNWSSLGLFVGEPAQEIDVTVSTSLSEIWVVGPGGCSPNALCAAARGGIYNNSASRSWSPLGAWRLGLEYLGLGGNGDYGMETVVVYDSVRRWQTSFNKQLVASIIETGYYTGFFGLGITPGRFEDVVANSPIATLVQQDGTIPSHSYGYTAGAYYGGSRGTPLSLTLGGYDTNRFEPHDVKFSLNSTTRQPDVLVRAITASVTDASRAPTPWSASSTTLSSFNESMVALLDSSTPYLWLPSAICDRFAASFNLTWDERFGLYLFPDHENLDRFRSSPGLSFAFALSSADNRDNFGRPLDVPGVVNLTISANAFIQSLRYPFMNLIEYGAPAQPYFPLKRLENGSRVVIGRTFFQEAYLITNYETGTFSVHKAKFPERPLRDTSIQTVATFEHSPYPGPPERPSDGGLTESQTIGLAVGACALGIGAIATFWFVRRRRRNQRASGSAEESDKDKASTIELSPPNTPVARIVSKMSKNFPTRKSKKGSTRSGRSKRSDHDERDEQELNKELGVYEFAADQNHERYELPGPEPVELDSTMTKGPADAGRGGYRTNTYEYAQCQPEQQKRGLMSKYNPRMMDLSARAYHSTNSTTQYGSSARIESPSPASSPTHDTLSNNIPSPLSSRSDWTNGISDVSSPLGFVPAHTLSHSTSNPNIAYAPPSPSSLSGPKSGSLGRSASTVGFPMSNAHQPTTTPASFQRAPIESSRVVCLGPLPDSVRLPQETSTHGVLHIDGRIIAMPPMPPIPSDDGESHRALKSNRVSTADTLGSNYTLEEEARMAASRETMNIFGRIEGADIIHIPQPASRRYSWEEQ
ncbi:acid protease [Durotheca rogersii]|uniref:acid protease n=1 Tax=Durotheca rogersii TaxID=419775 RepID=UPI00221F85F6|nr:acid protease [Durotheca rogersii]KAI5868434.1 acid protease [Durotheca rogersii]